MFACYCNVYLHTYMYTVYTHTVTLTPLFFTAFIWSYGRGAVSRCVWSPQHNCEWVTWPHLYPVGHGRAKLHHSVSRTHNQHLCTGHQWSHCKSTFGASFFPLLCLISLSSFCPLKFLAHFLSCFSPSLSSQHEEGRVLTVNSMNILFVCVLLYSPPPCISVCICAHMNVNTVNLSKGEIASCAGPQLYLWTMKGQLLTCTDTSWRPQSDILCISFAQRHEWDSRNVIVTGCADGIIRVRCFCCCWCF